MAAAESLPSAESIRPLSEIERVLDAFVAPSKTFTDILRSARWWLPCILMMLVSFGNASIVLHRVGVEAMSENLIHTMPQLSDRIETMKPQDALEIRERMQHQLRMQLLTGPLIYPVASLLIGGLFLAVVNFGFGGNATYGRMVAMYWYSTLPLLLFVALSAGLLLAGVGLDHYQVANPVGTNIGYYMNAEDTPPLLRAFLSLFDLFSAWIFSLQVMGVRRVSGLSMGKSIAAVSILWVVYCGFKLLPQLFG